MGAIRSRLRRIRALRSAWEYIRYVRAGTEPDWRAYRTLRRTSKSPVGFTAKMQHKMGYDRRPMLRQFADKFAVRSYVAERVGDEVLTTIYASTNDPSTIDWKSLPREYVAKVTHGSGGIIIVSDRAPEDATLPVDEKPKWTTAFLRPEATRPDQMTTLLKNWLKLRYHTIRGGYPEWCYHGIPPAVIVEELLDDDGRIPSDYKLFVFDGVCRFIQVDSNRMDGHQRDMFSPSWEPLDVQFIYPRSEVLPARPRTLERMLEIASALGRGVDFVRVDLYSIGGRVVFGEMTNYPEASRIFLDPHSYDELWGSYWTLPEGSLR